jgi:hypothetical protein
MVERVESAEALVTRTVKLQGGKTEESQDVQQVQVHRFITEPATVAVSMGLTLNLGRYETARIDVGLKVPCYLEEVDAAYEYARKWVEEKVTAEAEDVRKFAKTREPLDM